jgi:hypothetical protein
MADADKAPRALSDPSEVEAKRQRTEEEPTEQYEAGTEIETSEGYEHEEQGTGPETEEAGEWNGEEGADETEADWVGQEEGGEDADYEGAGAGAGGREAAEAGEHEIDLEDADLEEDGTDESNTVHDVGEDGNRGEDGIAAQDNNDCGGNDNDESDDSFYNDDMDMSEPRGPTWICNNCSVSDNREHDFKCEECRVERGQDYLQIAAETEAETAVREWSRRPMAVGYDMRMTRHRNTAKASEAGETAYAAQKDVNTEGEAPSNEASGESGAASTDAVPSDEASSESTAATADASQTEEAGGENAAASTNDVAVFDGMGCNNVRRWYVGPSTWLFAQLTCLRSPSRHDD